MVDLTTSITTTGTINTSTLGTQTLTYSVTDAGNLTTKAIRSVTVVPAHLIAPNNVQALDYLPFGKIRTNEKVIVPGTTADLHDEVKKFTGYEYDESSNLSFAQNRYLNQDIGQFTTQDPVVQNLGNGGQSQITLLIDPQQQNAYSYGRNNPLRYVDPNGKQVVEIGAAVFLTTIVAAHGFMLYGALADQPAMIQLGFGLNDVAISGGSGIGPRGFSNPITNERYGFISNSRPSATNTSLNSRQGNNWANPNTLKKHFEDHGKDFGVKGVTEYAKLASNFYEDGMNGSYLKKMDEQGVIRIYDPSTNTFGSYNQNGTTRTFFKPTSADYFSRQPGVMFSSNSSICLPPSTLPSNKKQNGR